MREEIWPAYVRFYWKLGLSSAGFLGLLLLWSNYPVFLTRCVLPIGIALTLVFILWRKRRVRPVSDGSKGHWTLGSSFEDTIAIEGKPDYVRQGCFVSVRHTSSGPSLLRTWLSYRRTGFWIGFAFAF